MKPILVGIRNVLLWSYERGTWQYDVLCLLIILAVFLIPSRYFGDRDRTKPRQANEIKQVASKAGAIYHEINRKDLMEFLERRNETELAQLPEKAITLYLQAQLEKEVTLVGFVPFDTPKGNKGYRVWFK
jgi:hypothetical protein